MYPTKGTLLDKKGYNITESSRFIYVHFDTYLYKQNTKSSGFSFARTCSSLGVCYKLYRWLYTSQYHGLQLQFSFEHHH